MDKRKNTNAENERDILYHLLEEQIAYICVEEEKESMQQEIGKVRDAE
ncbi:hypothetical protein [Cytobacillus purgationiresistens]|uniref:Fur-regulated basic protein B n=1 Tax=Cytobacillus purgationiresistens TaxID=863449 RepID=A0ABU0ACE1_9BACI|nr:hypothetical protein [Cytobacillus purgationiresistens]MDQ0268386.1 hypothetical protein [Cytobacillus purgationiresistens]